MVANIRFEKDAIRELNMAKCYFDSLDKGTQFITDFENQISIITTMPEAFQIRYKKVRIVSFSSFSFTIHYVFENNIIVIFNILNQYQDY